MILLLLNLLLIILAMLFLFQLMKAFGRFQLYKEYTLPKDIPSVSVCIPARNEMHAMSECLERVLASDYEKLEIIVYDDSSADDTSLVVRSFAHAGVRFVAGKALPQGWLGKNHALQVLAEEASGSYIVFLDVDTIIQPYTITQLVSFMEVEKIEMTSVIPCREDTWRASVLFGVLRYFWQLILPLTRPATSGALWIIKRKTIMESLGGFLSFASSVRPEAHVAHRLGFTYKPLLPARRLGVSFEKKWQSQLESSRRLLYPLFGGKWWSFLVGIIFFSVLNAPTAVLISAGFSGWTLLHTVTFVVVLAYIGIYGLYLTRKWTDKWWLGMWLWPYIILQEYVLFILSSVGYWKGTITWKGRNVTAAKNIAPHTE